MDTQMTLGALLGEPLASCRPMPGGDVSLVYEVVTSGGTRAVAKRAAHPRGEAAMLRAFASSGVPAPIVLAVDDEWLVMSHVPSDLGVAAAWTDLGDVLERLHRPTEESYGWGVDHQFGSVVMPNVPSENWVEFWADQRLRCHLPHLEPSVARRLERLSDRLVDHLPKRPASALLHGDLWGGNILVSAGRVMALIDPACFHGDREVDVAMLTVFDRPPASFIDRLELSTGWQTRQAIYRLWPLLVHLRLFGNAYAAAVDRCLQSSGF